MVDPIFNINDVLLIITIVVSLVLALVQPMLPTKRRETRVLVTAFFLSIAMANIGVMLLWNVFITMPDWLDVAIPFFYSAAILLKGPVLYSYVRSIIDSQYHVSWRQWWHVLPLGVVWLVHGSTGADPALFRQTEPDVDIATATRIDIVWFMLKAVPLAYFVAALHQVFVYHRKVKGQFSAFESHSIHWLYWLTACFVVAGIWSLYVSVQFWISRVGIGVTENYVSFCLLVLLCYYSLTHAQDVTAATLDDDSSEADTRVNDKPLDALTREILKGVEERKLYLNPTLNIEQFAKAIDLPARDVSYTINKVFGKNFFEFINFYRIEAAKRLLEDKAWSHLTVLEILLQAGFNSKSSFQRFFKRLTGISPTEYRERHQSS